MGEASSGVVSSNSLALRSKCLLKHSLAEKNKNESKKWTFSECEVSPSLVGGCVVRSKQCPTDCFTIGASESVDRYFWTKWSSSIDIFGGGSKILKCLVGAYCCKLFWWMRKGNPVWQHHFKQSWTFSFFGNKTEKMSAAVSSFLSLLWANTWFS